jgi:hypothetical protein
LLQTALGIILISKFDYGAEITQSLNSPGIRIEISDRRDFDFESIQICCETQPAPIR